MSVAVEAGVTGVGDAFEETNPCVIRLRNLAKPSETTPRKSPHEVIGIGRIPSS
jgi:hypothetical protein